MPVTSARQSRIGAGGHPSPDRISVVIPAWNEAGRIGRAIRSTLAATDVETWVVDGGSRDGTPELVATRGARLLRTGRCRAIQMNRGAETARGGILLFLHADAVLPEGYDAEVRSVLARPGVVAGAFTLEIDRASASLRWIVRGANWRARRLQLPYGDQALFMRAGTFRDVGGYPEIPLMEDFELVRRLRRLGRVEISSSRVRASARRWRRLGPVRCTLINQLAVAGYLAGVRPSRLARWYELGRIARRRR